MGHPAVAYHDIHINALWAEHGTKPYWAMRALTDHVGGATSAEVDIDDQTWECTWHYSEKACNIRPRPEDDVENLHQYIFRAQAGGQQKFSVQFEPMFTKGKMVTPGGEQISVPDDIPAGVQGTIQSSNLAPDRVKALIPRLLRQFSVDQGYGLSEEYLSGPYHEHTTITGLEVYVRLAREQAKKLVRSDGFFRRAFELVADERDSKVEYSSDNRDIIGYNHQLRLNPRAARELFPQGPHYGLQIKHYHPKHVRRKDASDPLFHPKLGVEFRKRWNTHNGLLWSEWRRAAHRLEEVLMNVLKYANIPTKVDSSTFIEDDHFELRESEHDIAWFADPTPTIERRRESMLVKALSDATGGHADVLEALVADGGVEMHVDELAEQSGRSVATVYRALERLDGLLENEDGTVRFVCQQLRSEVREILDRVEHYVDYAAQAVAQVFHIDERYIERAGSAWMRWVKKYGVEPQAEGERMSLKIEAVLSRLRKSSHPRLSAVLAEGLAAWRDAGRDPIEFLNAGVTFQSEHGPEHALVKREIA